MRVGGHVGAELGPDDHLGVGDPQPVRPLQPAVSRHPVPGEEVAALGVLEGGTEDSTLRLRCPQKVWISAYTVKNVVMTNKKSKR